MKLSKIIENINTLKIIGNTDIDISLLSQDSRQKNLSKGLYFAVVGTRSDGHDFIADTINKGISAVVCSVLPDDIDDTVCYVVVENVAKEMGKMAGNFYGNPSGKIKIVAITGTNGKTSVAHFAAQSLHYLGQKTLLLSTAGDYYLNEKISVPRSAPSSLEIIELHKTLAQCVKQGLDYCMLEATSIGLHQHRLSGIDIDYAIFTNLADDHLDYHGSMLNYANAKRLLFDKLKPEAVAISNSDDDYGIYMLENTSAQKIYFGSGFADYIFDVEKMDLSGFRVTINDVFVKVSLIGLFNLYNISAVFCLLDSIGFNNNQICTAFSSITGIPGRMQMVENNHNILAIVDYAHTADALDNVLQTLLVLPHNKIITVVGCGGDRDTTKRAPMAEVTQKHSDIAIFTSDNPRSENPQNIFNDMKQGIDVNLENYHFIESRESAIKKAVEMSEANDIILIAGKGHEDYQIIGTAKIHFDDTEVVNKYLNN